MMEEINDDTNGESSFEFVGKSGESLTKNEAVSSVGLIPPQESTPVTNYLLTTASPTNSGLSSQPVSSRIVSQPSFVTIPSSQTPVPMFDPRKQSMPAMQPFMPSYNSPVPTTSPYIPPDKGYLPTPTSPLNIGHPITESAFELSMADPYKSPSDLAYNAKNERGVWGWIKGNDFLNKVAEKAKSSVDTVITTLDPGMKEIIYSGGDLSIVVASTNDIKVSAIREAFQQVFGKATVDGAPSQATCIAPQPVGFSAGSKAAEERITNLRQQGLISEGQVAVAVENFLAEFTPDKWFDLGCLYLQDPSNGITLQVYTQATPVDSHFVMQAKEQTPADFPLGWSGYAVSIGQVLGPHFGVHHSDWHEALSGISRRQMLTIAAKSLAGVYKAHKRRPL